VNNWNSEVHAFTVDFILQTFKFIENDCSLATIDDEYKSGTNESRHQEGQA
jgi:hypothetical protein